MKKSETYGMVMAEISRLQQRAAELRKSELPGVIERIREAIGAYGLSAADLGFGAAAVAPKAAPAGASPTRGRKRSAAKAKLTVGVPKYRDPKTGKTWTGRGKPPLWIVGAKDRTPFLIDQSAAAPAAEAAPAKAPKGRGPKAAAKRGRRGRKPGSSTSQGSEQSASAA